MERERQIETPGSKAGYCVKWDMPSRRNVWRPLTAKLESSVCIVAKSSVLSSCLEVNLWPLSSFVQKKLNTVHLCIYIILSSTKHSDSGKNENIKKMFTIVLKNIHKDKKWSWITGKVHRLKKMFTGSKCSCISIKMFVKTRNAHE